MEIFEILLCEKVGKREKKVVLVLKETQFLQPFHKAMHGAE